MPEVGFQDLRSGFRARDLSPDSVIFTGESNFSLFSSASGSVERCSFTSDVPDQDSITSVVSQHLAGHELSQVLSGPDPDPNKLTLVHKNSVSLSRKEKVKVQKLDSSEAETTEDENTALNSARNSFSQALKECQDRRIRSEKAISRKTNRQRPASLDLNNNSSINNTINSSSPTLVVMKKPSHVARKTAGTFPSPGTPNYRNANVGIQKGWSSERVPLHTNANMRNVNMTTLLPYNRTLPSKWEDAERWIFSPVSGDGTVRASVQQPTRRPKAKSGPLGPPGIAYYQLFSPVGHVFDGGHNGKLIGNSPFSDGLSVRYGGCEGGRSLLIGNEPCMARSISIHGCSEMISQSSVPVQRDEKHGCIQDSANTISGAVSRRDMATQMSPESSKHSSPNRTSSFSLSNPNILPLLELHKIHSSRPEIRDVTVDERVTMTRWSKKSRTKNVETGSRNGDERKRKAISIRSAKWEVSSKTSTKSISKVEREEAKISAWENMQKAKAEAQIRKLEMKLEKKRSSSMDKIMNKLRSAQKKAQEMRISILANQITRSSDRALSFRRTRQIGSLSGCFTCHAF